MASITKTAAGTYRVAVKVDGRRKTKQGFKTKRDAQAWADGISIELREQVSADIPSRPFGDAMQRYLEQVSVTKKGVKFERTRINAWLGLGESAPDPLVYVMLVELQPKHIADWRDRRLKEVSVGTVLREWNLLSNICTKCVKEWGWLRSSPMTSVKRPKEPKARTRRPSDLEIAMIEQASGFKLGDAPDAVAKQVGGAFLFAIETAMRAGEILGAQWAHIDFDDRILHIPESKNDCSRDVPLSKNAVAILQTMRLSERAMRGPFWINSASLDANYRRLRARCGIEDLRFHDTRREALTRLSKKLDVMTLAKVSGHKDLRILQEVYYAPKMKDMVHLLD